jgi:hypothetical protein
MERGLQEPQGIGFFSIKTGETHYAKLEPTITAYINSSDMGINASRGQDFGWRLEAAWVKKIRDFRSDEDKMDTLAAKLRLEDGVSPSATQILYYIYGRQVRAYLQHLKEESTPFEEQYQQDISAGRKPSSELPKEPALDTVSEDVDENDLVPADDEDDDEQVKEMASRGRGRPPKATQAK